MHWYKNGKRHEFLKADGKPYVRIPRKVVDGAGVVPGVTDVLKSFGKSFWMPKYFGELGIKAAIEVWQEQGDITSAWYEKAGNRLEELSDEPADRGALIHWAIQQFYEGKDYSAQDQELNDIFKKAVASADSEVKRLMPTAIRIESESTFSTKEYGGTIDIQGYDANDWRVGIIDFKTVKEKRPGRLTEVAQLESYLRGKSHVERDGGLYQIEDSPMLTMANVYIDSNTGELIGSRVWERHERDAGWQLFRASLDAFNIYWTFEES